MRNIDMSTDHDLCRRVENYLVGFHRVGLRQLQIEADRGVVTLRGRVSTFYEKQLALNCCNRVAGVRQLIDKVDVADDKGNLRG